MYPQSISFREKSPPPSKPYLNPLFAYGSVTFKKAFVVVTCFVYNRFDEEGMR